MIDKNPRNVEIIYYEPLSKILNYLLFIEVKIPLIIKYKMVEAK